MERAEDLKRLPPAEGESDIFGKGLGELCPDGLGFLRGRGAHALLQFIKNSHAG